MNPHGLANILGRFFLALIFLVSGYNKIMNWDGAIEYMTNYNVPYPDVLLPIAVVVEIAGALLLVLGFKAQWAALALVVFLIPTTYYFHAFWQLASGGNERRTQMILFMKNVAIAGGLLIVAARGAGPGSVDESRDIERKVRA